MRLELEIAAAFELFEKCNKENKHEENLGEKFYLGGVFSSTGHTCDNLAVNLNLNIQA